MIKKTLTLPLFLFIMGCQDNSNVYVENTLIQQNLEKHIQKESAQDIPQVVYEPIISPEEYKKLIEGTKKEHATKTNIKKDIQEEIIISKTKNVDVNQQFLDFYDEWKGIKYKFGGNSKKGIDCSAFTQRIFKEKFDIKIPRSTRTQVKVGTEIEKSELELGDLVFFKTGKQDRHVGIYMGKGDFMHASIKGVKYSKLNKPFYKKAYWTSRRIID